MTEYFIPTGASETELVEKRSRFLGHVWPVESEGEARARIEEIRKKHYDARHNCWCYRIREGGVERYSDDGEPQGTAGQPMLNVFQREGVTNVCCVVTRYFGGILLGAGGWCGPTPSPPRTPWTRRASPWCAAGWRWPCPAPTPSLSGSSWSWRPTAGCWGRWSTPPTSRCTPCLAPRSGAEAFSARLTELAAGVVAAQVCGESFQAVPRTQV